MEKQRKKLLFIKAPFGFVLGLSAIYASFYESKGDLRNFIFGFLLGLTIVLALAVIVLKNWKKRVTKKQHKQAQATRKYLWLFALIGTIIGAALTYSFQQDTGGSYFIITMASLGILFTVAAIIAFFLALFRKGLYQ